MIFTETPIQGAFVIDLEKREDARGFFARAWCAGEFEAHGLIPRMAQANLSYNRRRGTLRGMHFQTAPHAEAKIIRCLKGALYDAIIDLRTTSPSYGRWFGLELSESNRTMLYVPEGCAHGFQTLADETEAFYFVSAFYAPGYEDGIRYDDPAFGVVWPLPVSVISDKDLQWPAYGTRTAACTAPHPALQTTTVGTEEGR
ncbi:dTDP-4-dehydrorhamnose 3,5-epimerase [Candidatus Nitrospira bockiana]